MRTVLGGPTEQTAVVSVCWPGRRLPVQGLSEGSLGYLDRLPAWRGPGTGAVPGLPEIKEKSGIWNLVPVLGLWLYAASVSGAVGEGLRERRSGGKTFSII